MRVLVTGGSGFVAGHVILALLGRGFEVRATLRTLTREAEVRARLRDAGLTRGDQLAFVPADLLSDDGWADAAAAIDAVLHVASPVLPGAHRDEDVVPPAREGTLRVLRAARDAGVRRVVLTSAFHAAGFGHRRDHGEFTEDDWSPLRGPGMDAYGRSKVLAERAAWEFVAGGGPELVALLPVAVMGPVLGDDVSGANHLVQRMLSGGMPGTPRMSIPIVDVRDVAAAHAAAVDAPAVAGTRILVATGEPATPLAEVSRVLRERLGGAAAKAPTRRIPDLVVRLAALGNPEFRAVAAELGVVKRVSDRRMRELLGVDPRPSAEAVVAAGESLVARGLV